MNWYYVSNGSEIGPVSAAKLRKLTATGKLRPDDMVRSDKMDRLVPAEQIEGLIYPSSSSAIDKIVGDQASKESSASPTNSVVGNSGIAQPTVDAAKLESLKVHALPQADLAIGVKAFRFSLGPDVLQSQYEKLRRLETEITQLKKAASIGVHSASIGQTNIPANSATTLIDIEGLLNKGKRTLATIGQEIRQEVSVEELPELAEEVVAARHIAAQIKELQRAAHGRHKRNRPVRGVALAIGTSVLTVVLVGWIASLFLASDPNNLASGSTCAPICFARAGRLSSFNCLIPILSQPLLAKA